MRSYLITAACRCFGLAGRHPDWWDRRLLKRSHTPLSAAGRRAHAAGHPALLQHRHRGAALERRRPDLNARRRPVFFGACWRHMPVTLQHGAIGADALIVARATRRCGARYSLEPCFPGPLRSVGESSERSMGRSIPYATNGRDIGGVPLLPPGLFEVGAAGWGGFAKGPRGLVRAAAAVPPRMMDGPLHFRRAGCGSRIRI